MSMTPNKLTVKDPYSSILVPGVVVWRPVDISHEGGRVVIKPSPVKFVKTQRRKSGKDTWVAKMTLTGNHWSHEPQVRSFDEEMNGNPVITIFCNSEPPADWTHLVISGVSHMLRAPGRNYGGVVFCDVPKPYSQEDYSQFRTDLYVQIRRSGGGLSFEDRARLSSYAWPTEQRLTNKRLVIQYVANRDHVPDEVAYHYLVMSESDMMASKTKLGSAAATQVQASSV